MRIKLLFLFSAIVAIATAQNTSLKPLFDNTRWTDGEAVYAAQVNGDFINMTGDTCHEGGYAFGLKCTNADPSDPRFTLEEGYWSKETGSDPSITIPCPQGSMVVTYNIEGNTYLVVEDTQGDATYCLRKMMAGEELKDLLVSQQKSAWTGSYTVAYSAMSEWPEGTDCEISVSKFQLGSWVDDDYRVYDEYETPTNVIMLPDGRYVKLLPHAYPGDLRTGLSLYEVDYNLANDSFEIERVVMVLDRTRGSWIPRWPTDRRLLLPGEITHYPKQELRLMRNEIFARHGYNFSSADLKEYFMGESWYEMDSDPDVNKKIHFSLPESINIAMLKSAEANKSFYFPEYDGEALQQTTWSWNGRRVQKIHDYNEIDKLAETVKPFDIDVAGDVTFEWCKAEGTDFRVGLSHQQKAGNPYETKSILILKNGSHLAYPMLFMGEDEPLPETNIHISGNYLWLELKYESKTHYYFYNVQTHVLSRSDRSAYQNRTAPSEADKTSQQLINNGPLSPKAY